MCPLSPSLQIDTCRLLSVGSLAKHVPFTVPHFKSIHAGSSLSGEDRDEESEAAGGEDDAADSFMVSDGYLSGAGISRFCFANTQAAGQESVWSWRVLQSTELKGMLVPTGLVPPTAHAPRALHRPGAGSWRG